MPALRGRIADRYSQRGLPTTPDQVLITSGALHGLDLVLRLVIGPGDRVLTDSPTYPTVLDELRDWARYWGWAIGSLYGEPFVCRESVGLRDLRDLR